MMGVKPSIFKYNGLYAFEDDCKDSIGLIANELQKVIPEAIFTVKGKLRPTDTEETDILHFDLTSVVMATVNAIKEHTKSIDDHEARIKKLEEDK